MRVKGTILRTRMEFLQHRFGKDAPGKLLQALSKEDRRIVETVMAGSWVPFQIANRLDETIAQLFAGGVIDVCRDIGVFSATRNLSNVYKLFVDQSAGDPQRLMENLATLHRTLYDWGWTRAIKIGERSCRLEGEYEGGATRANCLTAVGFYGEALRQLGFSAEVRELGCQVTQAPLCIYEIHWK